MLHHVIQFFHHVFHGSSGVFHHLAHHRITAHILFLFLLPRRVYAWLSLPIDRHRAQDFHPYYRGLFIPLPLSSHWSTCPDLIRTSPVPIGQLFPIPSRVPIGPLSLFKELPWSPESSFQVDGLLPRSQPRRLCFHQRLFG